MREHVTGQLAWSGGQRGAPKVVTVKQREESTSGRGSWVCKLPVVGAKHSACEEPRKVDVSGEEQVGLER